MRGCVAPIGGLNALKKGKQYWKWNNEEQKATGETIRAKTSIKEHFKAIKTKGVK
jgi:hypothetical protein